MEKKFYWKPNKYYNNDIITEYDKDLMLITNYNSELMELCNDNNLKYISMKDVLKKDNYIDGLHPKTIGHKKIFEKVVKNV